MRVQLKLVLDCSPDDAWTALRSPSVLTEVSWPFLSFEPLSPRGMPRLWPEGPHPVRVTALLGIVPVGDQSIDIHYSERAGVCIVEDSGGPISGALAVVTDWRHRMAVSPAPRGKTLYRDRLDIGAGVLTPLVWFGAWLFWQWRAIGLRRLAVTWRS